MEFNEIEQAQYNKLFSLISDNSFEEAKEYAYELLRIKSKDCVCYLCLIKIYSELNNSLKINNIISKIQKEISYFKSRQTNNYINQLAKLKTFINENILLLDEKTLITLYDIINKE